jgi:NAD(P)-dependent dehydrogenase (short-subunit alcohol dehydrogenase family)
LTGPRLSGSVVVIGVDAPAVARGLAAEGATVVLVGGSPDAAGALARELEPGPGRVAVFAGDPSGDTDALVEFVAELFS